jgi:tetratricopeptide (TPR) repeat protein
METLIERGFLRKATADEVRAAADAAYESRDFLRASRLYERAAQHVPLDESIRQRIADSLRDAGEKRLAAKHLVRLGMLRLKGGSAEAAVDTFRAAVALDDGDADAREGLQRALVAAGRSDDVVPATQAAAALRMSVKDFAGALRVADHGLAHRADDASLHVTRAGALQGLSRVNDAVASLDQAAKILTDAGVADERLIDVLRRIVQLDPERRDCGRRLEEFNATTAAGRRRKMQRVAVAAGVLLLACAAVPVLRGPSVESRIAEARGLVEGARNDAKKAEEARAVLDSIPAEELSADEAVDVEGLRRRLEQALHKSDGAEAARRLDAALDAEYRKCSAAILE